MECLDTKASVFAMFIFQDSLAKTSVYFLMLQQIMEYLDTKTKEEECCSPFCSKPGQAKSTPFDRASCRFRSNFLTHTINFIIGAKQGRERRGNWFRTRTIIHTLLTCTSARV